MRVKRGQVLAEINSDTIQRFGSQSQLCRSTGCIIDAATNNKQQQLRNTGVGLELTQYQTSQATAQARLDATSRAQIESNQLRLAKLR